MASTITLKQLRSLGLHPPATDWHKSLPEERAARRAIEKSRQELFRASCKAWGLPEPVPEYQFAPPRKWRFDWCFADLDLALEIEGGSWTEGRHTRGQGFRDDCEKYKSAIVHGWFVLRVTPEMVESGQAFAWIKEIAQSMGLEDK